MTDRLISCDDHMDLSQLPADLWTTRWPPQEPLPQRIGNLNALRQRSPPRGPRPRDIIVHTRTLAAPGAAATAAKPSASVQIRCSPSSITTGPGERGRTRT